MIGSLIGAGLNVAGGIFGSIASSRADNEANRMIVDQKAKNQAWYDREYNSNYTQRSDVQDVLNNTREMLNERYNRAAGINTVMGGTDESLAMSQANANDAVADTMSNIAADASAYKDNIQQTYMNNDAALTQQQVANQQQKAQNISNAVSGASQGAAGIVGSIFDKK